MLLHSYQAKKKKKKKRGPRFQKGDVVPWLTSKKRKQKVFTSKGGGGGWLHQVKLKLRWTSMPLALAFMIMTNFSHKIGIVL